MKTGIHLLLRLLAYTSLPSEPICYGQASKDLNWCAAMSAQFNSLMHNGTWMLVPRTSHMNVVGCKLLFKLKQHPDNSIKRYKASLVAKGYSQQHGIDFIETFSPIIKITIINFFLALAISSTWSMRLLDVYLMDFCIDT